MNESRELLLLQPIGGSAQPQDDCVVPPKQLQLDVSMNAAPPKARRRRHSDKDLLFTNPETLHMLKEQWRREQLPEMEESRLVHSAEARNRTTEKDENNKDNNIATTTSKPPFRRGHSEKDVMFTHAGDLNAFMEQWRKEHPKQ